MKELVSTRALQVFIACAFDYMSVNIVCDHLSPCVPNLMALVSDLVLSAEEVVLQP